jgi:hypothetical protein
MQSLWNNETKHVKFMDKPLSFRHEFPDEQLPKVRKSAGD